MKSFNLDNASIHETKEIKLLVIKLEWGIFNIYSYSCEPN